MTIKDKPVRALEKLFKGAKVRLNPLQSSGSTFGYEVVLRFEAPLVPGAYHEASDDLRKQAKALEAFLLDLASRGEPL